MNPAYFKISARHYLNSIHHAPAIYRDSLARGLQLEELLGAHAAPLENTVTLVMSCMFYDVPSRVPWSADQSSFKIEKAYYFEIGKAHYFEIVNHYYFAILKRRCFGNNKASII
jgi:hypothetical protein